MSKVLPCHKDRLGEIDEYDLATMRREKKAPTAHAAPQVADASVLQFPQVDEIEIEGKLCSMFGQ